MSSTEIQIVSFAEPYTGDDVAGLIVPIQQEEFGIPITAADQPDLYNIPRFYQQRSGNFWLALHQNQIVGTIALVDIGNRQGALRKMFVHRDFRGSAYGVSRRLLTTLLDWAAGYGLREIYLGTTAKFLAAQRFYTKNGFVEISQSELPAQFPRMLVDNKFYRYALELTGQ